MASQPAKPLERNFSVAALEVAQRALEELVTANQGITFAVLTSADGFEVAAFPRNAA